MHRKMTRLALGGKCGVFGASGPARSAAAASVARPAKARSPKPQDDVLRKVRREGIRFMGGVLGVRGRATPLTPNPLSPRSGGREGLLLGALAPPPRFGEGVGGWGRLRQLRYRKSALAI